MTAHGIGGTEKRRAFPWLPSDKRIRFPDPEPSSESLVAYGGNLSPGVLLSAYEQGLFPWYGPNEPILWHSPNPRFVLFPEALHVSESMRRVLKRCPFRLTLDNDFPGVIWACAEIFRPGQNGTWIGDEMRKAYIELHRLGWAHSAEAYLDGALVGACYGLRLGAVFFGESMFTRVANASKAAFISLARLLFNDGVSFIDCQVPTDHLRSLGARELERDAFRVLLKRTLGKRDCRASDEQDRRGNWGRLYGGLPPWQEAPPSSD